MTLGEELKMESRVRVSPMAPRYQGRIGMILEQRDAPREADSRAWLVRFDWPLGGMGSYDVVGEEHLEPLGNIPIAGAPCP